MQNILARTLGRTLASSEVKSVKNRRAVFLYIFL